MAFRFTAVQPPAPMRRPTQLTIHGDVRIDDYYWLRHRDDPEVIAYLTAENAYTAAVMRDTEPLQEALFQEMRGRIQESDSTVPVQDGTYWYYRRTVAGLNYPIYCRRAYHLDAAEEILLDVNELAAGYAFCKVGEFAVSPDHSLLAYALDRTGNEIFTIFVKDLRTGELLPDRIEGAYYGLEWGNDNVTLFYTTLDHAYRPDALWRHRLGSAQADDVLLWREPDERFFVQLYKTRSRRFIVMHLHSNMTSEARVLDADTPDAPLRLIEPRRQGHEYFVEQRGEWFYLLSNDGAQDFRVLAAPLATPGMTAWREVVPETPGILVERIEIFQNHLALFEWAEGNQRVRVLRLAPEQPEILDAHVIAFDEESYAVYPDENPTFDTTTLRLRYSSLKTPETIYAYDMEQRTLHMLKQEVIRGHDASEYATQRLWATAPDGAQIPISLVHRKGIVLDGSHPCLLYGYGAYGASTVPSFRANRLSLLERGFLFAIAHVRGGSEKGRAWYLDGKLLRKKNTFTDFIAAAETLIAQGYTSPERLTIMGRSAGGLLMGAVVNMRPDLFAGVIAEVPFVDVINTMLDPTLPLTVIEYEEWGNPANPEYYVYMRSYSPYDNIEAKAYPPLLATAGLNDPRVSYWEPAKFVAKLRSLKTDDNVVLLKTNMAAGHGGASGRYDALRETAFEYTFLLKVTGLA
ncbi:MULTISPECIES: S9 family peptidase [Caldilinea]|jgi:oligopeptidase B|uniref:Protease II n=1 Tax=Caldilinea aerophila (strain DSM 14535 / JCM 11387 / NBRC 104270 / STL-6-O1) TaxID=926550 RepID=I0HYM0_CALAS|nr:MULTISPECIES: oligopeptidase B [Caldilinea]MBO9391574.1 oligopeptidase B [Caldilinea sp.]BAL98107.1 protease II [Caldilinea aerophila DSM 14535 = NBRC 104270]GIV75424.1 MAG: oligopeptidase B [Caldilinea sp.]